MVEDKSILFFDGVCGLCNRSVNFIISIDKKAKISFSPLQGKTAREMLPAEYLEKLDTLVFVHKGKLYTKSSAILKILNFVGGMWRLFYVFIIIPAPLRNWIYNLIAQSRYKWFGKYDICRMPTPQERNRFLD